MKTAQLFFLIIIISLFASTASAQLSLAPTAVFINPDSRTGTFMVTNTSEEDREVNISLVFPQGPRDSAGKLVPGTTAPDSAFSIVSMVKVFPKTFILKGQQSQIIRFIVMSKPGIPEGMYWSRLSVLSKPKAKPITETVNGQVPTQMIMAVEQKTLIAFKTGTIKSELNFEYDSVVSDSNNTYIRAKLQKSGNAPFWGTSVIAIYDEQNKEVVKKDESLAIFTDIAQRFSVGKKLPKGKYRAELNISNKQDAIPENYRAEINEKKYTIEFDIVQ